MGGVDLEETRKSRVSNHQSGLGNLRVIAPVGQGKETFRLYHTAPNASRSVELLECWNRMGVYRFRVQMFSSSSSSSGLD